ncbi:ABC transporter substrate-binding protein [Galbitalea soli]|uniref:ABC transporter substrate-binding protein n=1 Tax=Galbitalea soli TaxID=1268042 RepID=UPI00179D2A2D|nr:ABC transporter substrate-binding protein [Galbitalea soli]NYJ31771.1 peptide/nickel transport system substrate-binding protein [Galbitalea soli]
MTITRRPATRWIAVLTAALVAGSLAGCTAASSTPAASTSTITLAFDSDLAPQGYDPLRYQLAQAIMYQGLYDSLATLKSDGTTGPGLATEFVYNADKTKLTLTLASGVTFTDGSSLTAALVKANLDRRSDPTLVSYSAFAKGGAAEISSVDVVDASHVSLTFAKPQAGFESNLTGVAGMIVGQKAIDNPSLLDTAPDGSGPFLLAKSTVKGSSYVLTKQKGKAEASQYAYDTYIIKPITDPQARTNAVISGQADAGFITTPTAALAKSRGLGLSQIGGTVTSMLVFDKSGKTSKAFADPNVRVALGLAINRDELVKGLHPGDLAAVNALPKASPGYSADLDTQYAYNPTKAKALLAAAGYPNGFSFTIIGSAETQTDLEAIQKYFAAIGVTMTIKLASSTQEIFAAVNTTPLGYIPLGWGNPVGTMFGVILGFANPHGEKSPALAGAAGAVAAAQTDADRKTALTQLNTTLVSSGWIIPLYEQLTTWAYNGKKVAAVTYPGQNTTPLLSSFAPAK